METQLTPVEVFYSFAEADAPFLEQLERHLSLLRHEGYLSTWHQRQIVAGSNWQEELDRHLNTASLILLLVSSDFLASDYCYGIEMRRALQRYEAKEARVLPILLRSCDWQSAPFAALQVLPVGTLPISMWTDRDAAWADVVTGIRQVLHGQAPGKRPLPRPTEAAIWNIPFARNPFFTGRDALIEQLHTQLQTTHAAAVSQPQAINGLGGIGKTQLAIEYAYRYENEYQMVLWARADTTEALNASYTEIAGLLQLPQKEAQEQKVIVQAVKSWLRDKSGWLFLLDNADDLNMVQTFLPPRYAGHLLLTTRAQIMGKFARRLEVDTLNPEVGALLLLRRAGLLAPGALLTAASVSDQALALALTEEVGGLPLALDQAGAYIEETQCGLANYRQQYQTRRAELLAHRGMLIDDHPEPVSTTWSLSFAKVEAANPMAAEVLRICAFLAPDAIPEELLIEALKTPLPASEDEEPSTSTHQAIQLQEIDGAVAILRAYSLMQRNAIEKTLSVHRLVQAVVRDAIKELEQTAWITCVIDAVNVLFPVVSFGTWEQCARYLLQALVCDEWMTQRHLTLLEGASLLNRAGWYLDDRGQYAQAEPLYVRALAICEQQLGAEHPNTAGSLNNLALLYKNQGKYAQAEPLYVRTLAIREQQLGAEHPNTATSLNNLAALYNSQGKYAQATPLFQRALTIREQTLGREHPDTALSVWWLATLFEQQQDYQEAKSLYERALSTYEQTVGSEHQDTQSMRKQYATLLEKMKGEEDVQ